VRTIQTWRSSFNKSSGLLRPQTGPHDRASQLAGGEAKCLKGSEAFQCHTMSNWWRGLCCQKGESLLGFRHSGKSAPFPTDPVDCF
jgi:hypothetical protein